MIYKIKSAPRGASAGLDGGPPPCEGGRVRPGRVLAVARCPVPSVQRGRRSDDGQRGARPRSPQAFALETYSGWTTRKLRDIQARPERASVLREAEPNLADIYLDKAVRQDVLAPQGSGAFHR